VRYAKYLRVPVNGRVPPVAEVLRQFPSKLAQTEHGTATLGLGIRLAVSRETASGEVDLGESARFWPTDAALARWKAASHGEATVVYD
jgi:DNA polymerase-3 subunit alpha